MEVLIPLLECLASLHSHGIVHRQLKPEHIMVGRGSLHVLDFAEAVNKNQRCLNNRAGTMVSLWCARACACPLCSSWGLHLTG